MRNPDKHKPLSPEELFKLLDTMPNKVSDFDELDDFEKEALEGFSAHSNSQKAKIVMDELNIEISQKVSDSKKSDSKNKIVWFSAAASIVLVIMISVFFFNQTKKDSVTNIALNDSKEEKLLEEPQIEATPPLETISGNETNNYSVGKAEDRGKELAKILQPDLPKKDGGNAAVLTYEPTIGVSETKPVLSPDYAFAKDEAKSRRESEDNDQKKMSEGLVDKIDANKKDKNSLSQEQEYSEVTFNQNIGTTTKGETGYYKTDGDRTVVASQSLEKEKAASTTSAGSVSKAKKTATTSDNANEESGESKKNASAPASISAANAKTGNAYYIGSELAIRDYVVSYFKEKAIVNQAAGKFKISGTVDVNGVFKVIDIIQITRNNCNCIDDIKKALNSMNKWVTAVEDGKKVSSTVEFTIVF